VARNLFKTPLFGQFHLKDSSTFLPLLVTKMATHEMPHLKSEQPLHI